MHYWGNHFRQVGRWRCTRRRPSSSTSSSFFLLLLLLLDLLNHHLLLLSSNLLSSWFGCGLAPDGSTTQSHFNVLLSLTFASDPPNFILHWNFTGSPFCWDVFFSKFFQETQIQLHWWTLSFQSRRLFVFRMYLRAFWQNSIVLKSLN